MSYIIYFVIHLLVNIEYIKLVIKYMTSKLKINKKGIIINVRKE